MKILGLDLGIGSIGWALIETDDNYTPLRIIGMGCRIVPLSQEDIKSFSQKSGETICAKRTVARTIRKGMDRYQMRRSQLLEALADLGMIDPDDRLITLSPLELWGLRAKAAGQQLTLTELGRVLMHLNQKRGYKHAKSDIGKTKSDYLKKVNQNYAEIIEEKATIGQHFYRKLKESETTGNKGKKHVSYRIKDNVFPRAAYEAEFDSIMERQRQYYPDLLTDKTIANLKNIIFYQRPLKSCKHLVSVCEFEKRVFKNRDNKPVTVGPKVAPKSSPLAQVANIWESINNIRLTRTPDSVTATDADATGSEYILSLDEKKKIFDYLNTHKTLSSKTLLKTLGLSEAEFEPDNLTAKGLKGNSTYATLASALKGVKNAKALLAFDLTTTTKADVNTGEVSTVIDPLYINQPLYRLWHAVYSIPSREELARTLEKMGISDPETVDRLFNVNFKNDGYANRSAKFLRRILPYLMQGMDYYQSCQAIGVNHSGSITSEENENRILADKLEILPKNTLRQPLVEKVLNQMIHLVNAVTEEYGRIDEIRVELARELRLNKETRIKKDNENSNRKKAREKVAEIIEGLGFIPSSRNIQKYELWMEADKKCMYCGAEIDIHNFLNGDGAEIEHIIPRSIFFDDSLANRTCACRKCNREKNNLTAYEFMKTKSDKEFNDYLERIKSLTLTPKKRERLMTSQENIPTDFLNRDLTFSQYIARKAYEILLPAARNVNASSGTVTSFLRHAWGYDRILHDLNIDRYALAGRVKTVTNAITNRPEQRIENWSKRLDHRHHAIDALTVALTRQSYIQHLNNLNAADEDGAALKNQSVDNWARSREHFPVDLVTRMVEEIAIASKPAKLTSPGKRFLYKYEKRERTPKPGEVLKGKKKYNRKRVKIVKQRDILVPRGALHEQSIYGRIQLPMEKVDVKDAFEAVDRIYNNKVREAVKARIAEYDGDVKKAAESVKKRPVTVTSKKNGVTEIKKVTLLTVKYVLRYKVSKLKHDNLDTVIDKDAREAIAARFAECGNDNTKFQKSITEETPIVSPRTGMAIKTVRRTVKVTDRGAVAIRKDADGRPIGYAKTGENDHAAFYRKADGKVDTRVVSAWVAVKRKRLGVPVTVTDPAAAWDYLAELPETDDIREIAASLPDRDATFIMDMRMGEMFILGMSDEEFDDAIATDDKAALLRHMYRVQAVSENDYNFRLHTEATIGNRAKDQIMKALYRVQSFDSLMNLNPRKVKINHIGKLIF